MCRLMDGAWEGKEERAHGRTGPKPTTLQRCHLKKIFLPRYLGKNIFSSSLKSATRKIAKNPKTQSLEPNPKTKP